MIFSSVTIRSYNDTIYAAHEITIRHATVSATTTAMAGLEANQRFFHVQEPLLTARSKFFEITLKPDRFIESEKRNIRFTKQDPHIFPAYLSST